MNNAGSTGFDLHFSELFSMTKEIHFQTILRYFLHVLLGPPRFEEERTLLEISSENGSFSSLRDVAHLLMNAEFCLKNCGLFYFVYVLLTIFL